MRRVTKIFLGIACACIGIGIALAILAFAIGGRNIRRSDNTFSYDYTVNNIKSIDLDIGYGDVSIVEGNEFTAKVDNVVENGFQSYVEDDTWYLKQDDKITDKFDFFGLEIPFSFGWFDHHNDYYPTIVITVPSDFETENLTIDLGAGEIKVDQLDTQDADINIGAGTMEIRRLNVCNKVSCEVGAGELIVKKIQAKKANFECGVGSIKVSGEILGDLDADCGMGEMKFDLDGNEEDYNYDVSCGVGEIQLNDRSYTFSDDDRIYNENAIGTFNLNCSVGSLKVEIQ